MSYSVVGVPSRRRVAIASNARSLIRYSFSDASRCVAIAGASHTAANRCTRSPDDTTSTPNSPHQFDRAGVDARRDREWRRSASIPSRRAARRGAARAARLRAASRPAYCAFAPGRCVEHVSARWRAPGRAARRSQGSGSTSAAWPDARPAGRRRSLRRRWDSSRGSRTAASRRGLVVQRGLNGRDIERRRRLSITVSIDVPAAAAQRIAAGPAVQSDGIIRA